MKIFVVFCHPSKKSFTHDVCESFIRGLRDAGHEVLLSDLYADGFRTDLSEEEYLRESYYRSGVPAAGDVLAEQDKIQRSDAIAFVYPVLWTEAPAKLVGWFDRVWTTGFAYNPAPTMKTLNKALVIACAGKSMQALTETGEKAAMETVMLGDRIRARATEKEMVILDGITHGDETQRTSRIPAHLEKAYELGLRF